MLGQKLPVFVDFGTAAATTAIVGAALSLWLVRTYTDGLLSTRSVDRYLVLTPWMLSWEVWYADG